MRPRNIVTSALLGTGLGFCLSLPGQAAEMTVPIEFQLSDFDVELSSMNLAGSGSIPLGQGPAGVDDGYLFVASDVLVTESQTETSTLTGDLHALGEISFDPEDPSSLSGMVDFTIDIDYEIFAILALTDADPANDYVAGLPNPIALDPSTGTMTGTVSVDLAELASGEPIPGEGIGVADFLSAKQPDLGVDVNGNGENDFLEIFLTNLEADFLLDLDDVDFLDPDNGGLPQVSLNVDQLVFSGNVGDVSTDPPFGPIPLSYFDIYPAPAPSGLALLGIGLAVLWPRLRRAGRMSPGSRTD